MGGDDGEQQRGGGGIYGVYVYGGIQLGDGVGTRTYGVHGGANGGGGHVAGGGTDPQGKKDYRGIGLMEVIWKVVAEILNRRLTASITFHNFLHIFWAGCGTGTATLEAKLLWKLAALREEVLYVIFLDLHKSYDALDRSRCLEILDGYRVALRARRLLHMY